MTSLEPTPAPTPEESPMPSPSRQGAVAKTTPYPTTATPETSTYDENDPGIVLIAPKSKKINAKTHSDKLEMLKTGISLRYIYQNDKYNKEQVKSLIKKRKVDLTDVGIYHVETHKYHKIMNGMYLNLEKCMPQVPQDK